MIEAVIIPTTSGIHVGIRNKGTKQWFVILKETDNLKADTKELVNIVTKVLQNDKHTGSCLDNMHNVQMEFVSIKEDIQEDTTLRMVQLFHRGVVDTQGSEPCVICFVFYVLTRDPGEDMIVQINTKYHDDYIPISDYQLAAVPNLLTDESALKVLKFFFCVKVKSMLISLLENKKQKEDTYDEWNDSPFSDIRKHEEDEQLEWAATISPSLVNAPRDCREACHEFDTTHNVVTCTDQVDFNGIDQEFDQIEFDDTFYSFFKSSREPWLSYNWDDFEGDTVSMLGLFDA